jgi:class 3 adenylate cyclase
MTSFGNRLAEIGLRSYHTVFASNKIDFDVIRSLSDTDLRELGLALGDRKRLLQAVARLDERSPSVALAAGLGQLGQSAVSHGGERRQPTVMFCDVVSSTALSESSTLKSCRAYCTRIVSNAAR